MLAKIQTLILQEEMNLLRNPMSIIDVDGSSAIYLIFMIMGIIGYFCVPTVSNWIVQAGGMSSYNRNRIQLSLSDLSERFEIQFLCESNTERRPTPIPFLF